MSNKDMLELLDAHKSIRHFKSEPIPTKQLNTLMRLAQRASSGGAAQVYSVIRVMDPMLREQISEWIGQQVVFRAAEYFIYCMDVHRMRLLLAHRDSEFGMSPLIALIYGVIDCCLSSSNMAIAAEAMGYGICYVGAVQREFDKLIEALKLPEGVLPVLSLCLGLPDEDIDPRPRLPTDVVFHENTYREPTEENLERCFKAMEAVTFFGSWYKYLDRFFTTGKEFSGRDVLWERAMSAQGMPLDGGDKR